jgi:hypothetical protein
VLYDAGTLLVVTKMCLPAGCSRKQRANTLFDERRSYRPVVVGWPVGRTAGACGQPVGSRDSGGGALLDENKTDHQRRLAADG